jgi:putative redox protein
MSSERAIAAPPASTEPQDAAASAPWVAVRLAAAAPGYRTDVHVRGHTFVADEPVRDGGTDLGPTPVDYLLGAVGACTAITVRMYAARKQWPLEEAVVELRPAPAVASTSGRAGAARIERRIELRGPLTADQRRRLLTVADRCPVKRALEGGLSFSTRT